MKHRSHSMSPEDFAAGTGMNALAEKHQLLIVYPAQTGGDNSMSCWQLRTPASLRSSLARPRAPAIEYFIPKDRVFVAGLSASGAMAAIMGKT